jgi:two-component system CheB/CheR fusion protein
MPSLLLGDMLDEQLRIAVGAAIHRASHEKEAVSFSHVSITSEDHDQTEMVNLTVIPLAATRYSAAHTLVQFELVDVQRSTQNQVPADLGEAARDHVTSLQAELHFARESLQATIEELETSNEELQATNEELLASNEELQSTNEELHSVNEELFTVNSEYQKKIEEQTELTQDMNNLLRSTDVHTIFLDDQLCIRKFTPKMAEVFNLIDTDIGRRIHGFVNTIKCPELPARLEQVAREGKLYEEEVENKDGGQYLMRILPYLCETGRRGVVMTLIDITVLKAAETRFRNAVEVSPNGMLVIDTNGRLAMVNGEVEKTFGCGKQDLIGQPVEVLLPDGIRVDHSLLREEYFRHPRVIRRMGNDSFVWGQRCDGSRIPLDVRVNPIRTSAGTQAIASLVDVSEHQKLEESLRSQVQQRDRFLATLSHELRNPMGAILTAASLLNRMADGSADFQKPCEVIRRQATHIATLLDDLLDVSRVTQGKIKLRMEPVNVQDVCHESLEAINPLAAEHGHSVTFSAPDESLWVEVERVRLIQIVENLLTNAIKYTPDHGHIDVLVSREQPWARLEVRDDGCGMTNELLSSIFDMFVQSDQTLDRSEGGMGVGLTLVRSLVEMHGGTIDAQSDGPGKGSCFILKLPLTEKRPGRSLPNSQTGFKPEEIRLVLVEDNDDARQMLESLLVAYGYDVVASTSSGREGFDLIMRYRPDAALLDIGLPGLDGYQIARRVREKLGDQVRLLALTGYGTDEDHGAVLQAGFNEHLVKPISIKQLNQALGTCH